MSESVKRSFLRRIEEFNRDAEGIRFREQHIKGFLVSVSVVAVLMLCGINFFERLVEIQPSRALLLVRILLSALLLINLVVAGFYKKYRYSLYFFFYALTLFMALSAYLDDEILRNTFIGLNAILIVWFSLVPFKYKSLILHGCILVFLYFLLLVILHPGPVTEYGNPETAIFILFTFLAGSVISILTNNSAATAYYRAKELSRCEEQLKMLSGNMRDMLWEMDVQSRSFTYISPSCETLTGYRPDEIISKPVDQFLKPLSLDTANKLISEAVARFESTGLNIHIPTTDFEQYCKDGSTIHTEISATLISDNNALRIVGVSRNINDRKLAEKALLESEDKFRIIVDTSPVAMCFAYKDGKIGYANRKFVKTFGYTLSDIPDMECYFNALYPDKQYREKVIHDWNLNVKNARESGASLDPYEVIITCMDGSERNIIVLGALLGDITLAIYNDITDIKKAEETLRRANERLTFHFMQAPLGYIEWNENLEVIDWNPAAERIFGYSREEAITLHAFKIIVPPEVHPEVIPVWQGILNETGGGYSLNLNLNKSGQKLICEWHNTPLKDESGKVIGIASIVQDITERKKLEEELAKSHRILQEHYSKTLEKVQNYSEELQLKTNELLKLQKDNLQSQFETLKNQVNPHFLFNSLNVLNSLISIDPELAEKFTGQLSKIYRYVLEHKSEDVVPLSTEMDFLESYVFLLDIRFKDKLKVNINVPVEKLTMKIPPLTIQLLIENAIKHNVFSVKAPLHIDVMVDENDYLNVINNYQERGKLIESTGLGLQNITDRIGYFTRKKPWFGVRDNTFVAQIPLL